MGRTARRWERSLGRAFRLGFATLAVSAVVDAFAHASAARVLGFGRGIETWLARGSAFAAVLAGLAAALFAFWREYHRTNPPDA